MELSNMVELAYKLFFDTIIIGKIDQLLSSIYKILGFHVMVFDEWGNDIFYFPQSTDDLVVWSSVIINEELTNGQYEYIYKKCINGTKNKLYPVTVYDDSVKKYKLMSAIKKDNKMVGYSVFFVDTIDNVDDFVEIIRMFNDAVAVLLKDKGKDAGKGNEESLKIFSELIKTNGDLSETLEKKLEKFEIVYSGGYLLLISEIFEEHYKEDYYTNISLELMKKRQVISMVMGNRLITLLYGVGKGLDNNLKEFYIKRNLKTSISNRFQNIRDFKEVYERTLLTLKTAKFLKSKKNIQEYDEYAPLQIFLATKENYEPKVFVDPILTEIIEYDKNNRTEYYQTLEKYVLNMFDYKKVAKDLFLHKNTIVYRVNKMKELFNIDYNNQKLINNLFCNFYLLKMSE